MTANNLKTKKEKYASKKHFYMMVQMKIMIDALDYNIFILILQTKILIWYCLGVFRGFFLHSLNLLSVY